MSKQIRAKAIVQITMEVVCGTYGDDASFDFVQKQASQEAMEAIQILLQRSHEPSRFAMLKHTTTRVVLTDSGLP